MLFSTRQRRSLRFICAVADLAGRCGCAGDMTQGRPIGGAECADIAGNHQSGRFRDGLQELTVQLGEEIYQEFPLRRSHRSAQLGTGGCPELLFGAEFTGGIAGRLHNWI